jgi:hypothetical protein
MLAKQDKLLILGPSIVSAMLLALPELALSPAAQGIHHVCSLRTTHHVRPLLQAVELRLLMLDGDAYAWYEPKQGYLRLNGNGYGVILAKKPIAGNSPAAVEINVLAAGMGQHW